MNELLLAIGYLCSNPDIEIQKKCQRELVLCAESIDRIYYAKSILDCLKKESNLRQFGK